MDKQEKTQVSSMKEPPVETQVPSAKEPTVETQVPSANEPAVAPSLQSILDKACESYLHRDYGTTMSLTEQIILEDPVRRYADALYLRAKCYYYGNGVDRNLDAAERLLSTASEFGHRKAQNLLGVLFSNPINRNINEPVDYSKAFDLFQKAADKGRGEPEAMVNEGICHFWGLGTSQNPEHAVELFRAAAERGNNSAKVNLSLCYFSGIGVERDPVQGFTILKETTGDTAADYLMGCCYLFGAGVEQNLQNAYDMFAFAALFSAASEEISLTNLYCDIERQRTIQRLIICDKQL